MEKRMFSTFQCNSESYWTESQNAETDPLSVTDGEVYQNDAIRIEAHYCQFVVASQLFLGKNFLLREGVLDNQWLTTIYKFRVIERTLKSARNSSQN
jgi:hypothetical protein